MNSSRTGAPVRHGNLAEPEPEVVEQMACGHRAYVAMHAARDVYQRRLAGAWQEYEDGFVSGSHDPARQAAAQDVIERLAQSERDFPDE